ARYQVSTIPQVFVGGKHIGGASETFDAFKNGELQTLLGQSGVSFNRNVRIDPYSLLPSWLQPR
ncbi:MAG TPA: hypothetical protein VLT81_12570, partial [Chondromyces sp.]|nr:hypothetical protein [Chondromyces sp.]